ncbi:MAG: hypothetical protein HY289_08420 [Planctomycetes bacterium]|nr:hypothetical protein [Planctomycetota bacterium]
MWCFSSFPVGFLSRAHISMNGGNSPGKRPLFLLFQETPMSMLTSSRLQSIPTGILVSVSGKPCKATRPVPRRKTAPPARRLPWGWISVGGGTLTWVLMLAILAMSIPARDRSKPQMDPPQVAQDQPVPKPTTKPAAKETAQKPTTAARPTTKEMAPKPAMKHPGKKAEIPELISEQRPVILESKPKLLRQEQPTRIDITHADEKPQLAQGEQIAGTPTPPAVDRNIYADCEKIGTKVLFMKNPPDAFQRAKAEKKMVFMVHLSGNLEDKDCT